MSLPPGINYDQLAFFPAMEPPPNMAIDFRHPGIAGSSRPAVIALGAIFATITLLSCCLRLYFRLKFHKLDYDDGCAVLATICAYLYYGFVTAASVRLLDVHMWNIPILTVLDNIPLLRAAGYLYFLPTLLASKLTLGLLLLRIFWSEKKLRWWILGAIGWAVATSLTGFIWSLAACPANGITYLICSRSIFAAHIVAAGMNVFGDIILLAILLWGTSRTNMGVQEKRRKLIVIFLMGLPTIISSIGGLCYRAVLLRSSDVTWHFTGVNLFSMLEVDMTIIVSCLPSLRALFRFAKPKPSMLRPPMYMRQSDLSWTDSTLVSSTSQDPKGPQGLVRDWEHRRQQPPTPPISSPHDEERAAAVDILGSYCREQGIIR